MECHGDFCRYIKIMTNIEKPSNFEKVSGNLLTEIGVTALAAFAGIPLAALLPVLSNSIASGRHRNRVEKALSEINQILKEHEDKIRKLTDSQYKVINEIILAILQTTEDEKIRYLKSAIKNSIEEEKITITLASQISRILRDISTEEIIFLVKNSKYSRIIFSAKPQNNNELSLDPLSKEGVLVSGLVSLGLMVPVAATLDDVGIYQFSPLVEKLLELINEKKDISHISLK